MMRSKRASSGGFNVIQQLEDRVMMSILPPLQPAFNVTPLARNATTVIIGWDGEFTIGENGFRVERSLNGFTGWTTAAVTPPNTQEWIDSNLQPDTTYFYRVATFNSTGTVYSSSAAVITPPNSFSELDIFGALFVNRTAATDVVELQSVFGSVRVTVDTDVDFILRQGISRISLLRSTSDNGMTIDGLVFNGGVPPGGTLTVRGTLGNDAVGISANDNFFFVRINTAQASFSRDLVARISVMTYEGDDRISIGTGVGGVNVNGGSGNDSLFGNTGDDRLNGGTGNDLIKGNAGNDRLYGDFGDDVIYGQDGNDYLEGGDGADKLVGGNGDDVLSGGTGNDRLYGEGGIDELLGGLGFNFLKQE